MDFRLLSDEALYEPGRQGQDEDGLGFGAYSRVLAQGVAQSNGPITVGVIGEWGSGKTSLMRMMQRRLLADGKVTTVWFNAWRYEQDEHPVIALVGTIVKALEARSQAGKASQTLSALIRALRAVAYGFSMKSSVKVPGLAGVEASFSGKDMIEREEALQKDDSLLARSLFHQTFEALDAVDFANELRVVVFIDDLDRCFPDQAVKLLESVKLVLAQPGFAFVLGASSEVLEGYLQHRYAKEYGINRFQGKLYLDKMVQLSFRIPPSLGRMQEFSGAILADQPSEVSRQLTSVLPLVGHALGGNPRSVKRFLNNLLVDLAINADQADQTGATAIPIHFFALTRCLQLRWPETLTELMPDDDLAQEVAGWDRDTMRAIAGSDDDKGPLAAALLSDRELHGLILSVQGREWLNDGDLRRASLDFLASQSRMVSPADDAPQTFDLALVYPRQNRTLAVALAEVLTDYGIRVLTHADVEGLAQRLAKVEIRSLLLCSGFAAADLQQLQRLHSEIDSTMFVVRGSRLRAYVVLLPGSTSSTTLQPPGGEVIDLRAGITVDRLRPIVNTLRMV